MKVINANRLPLFCLLLLCACQLLVSCSWEDYQHPDWTKDRAKIRAMKFVDKENELSEFSKILVSKWICSINRNSRGTLEAYSCFPIDHNFYEKRSVEIPKDFVSPKVLDDENGWSFWSLDTEPNGYSLEIPAWTGGVKKCAIFEYAIYSSIKMSPTSLSYGMKTSEIILPNSKSETIGR